MGQIERSVVNIIAALNRINASIQKTSVYISANTYALGDGYVINTVGVGGTLGILGITTLGVGSVGGISEVLAEPGALDSQPELISSADSVSGVPIAEPGIFDVQPGLVGFTDGVSGVPIAEPGIFDRQPGCVGDAEGISGISGRLQFILIEMAGLSDEVIGDADGLLDSQPGCVGLVAAASNFANVSELSFA